MTTLNIVQVALQLFCSFILLFPISDIMIRRRNRVSEKTKALLYMFILIVGILLSDSVAYFFRGQCNTTGRFMVWIGNFGVFLLEYILQLYFCIYLNRMIEECGGKVNTKILRIVQVLIGIGIAGLIVTQFNGLYYTIDSANVYSRSKGIMISYMLHMITFLVEFFIVFPYRKQIGKWNYLIVGSYFVVIVIFSLVQLFWYGISFTNIGITFSVMTMFVWDSLERMQASIEQMQKLVEYQKKSEEMRQKILLSTIQPHFLFNTLNAIEGLIMIDPDHAITAVGDISGFMRASIDMLNSDEMIQISKEIQIVQYYLSLIELRFWGKIVTKISGPENEIDYLIPPFTLQPLVENAINHGIRKKKDGRGTLTLRCREEEEWHVIEVADDGVGFEKLQKEEENEHVHMGITIVRERLSLMCGGTLTIQSTPGIGTTCEIRIPIDS